MLALLLGIGIVFGIICCNEVDSCTLQVNGTIPRTSIISTMPNGGHGYAWTTMDCFRGLIGLTENCKCQRSMIHGSPGDPKFCYFSGNYTDSLFSSYQTTHFCKNQNGQNTFSTLNSSHYLGCYCFDMTTGMQQMATYIQPVCKNGTAEHIPCSTNGENDNAALLKAYTGADQAVLNLLSLPKSEHFGKCQCGHDSCSASEGREYCHDVGTGYCSEVPACQEGKLFAPVREGAQNERMSRAGAGNLNPIYTACQCGYFTCGVKEVCETKVIDGIKKYVCTYNGQSSSLSFLLKTFSGAMGLAFIFSLIALVCVLLVIVFWILTCLKVNRAAKLAETNIAAQ